MASDLTGNTLTFFDSFGGTIETRFTSTSSILTFDGSGGAGTCKLASITDPTDPQDAATKAYVDSLSTPPGGNDENVQYNNSGSFGGSDTFNFNGTNQITVGAENSNFTITTTNGTSVDTPAGNLTLSTGSAVGPNADGGNLTFTAGSGIGTGTDGSVFITGLNINSTTSGITPTSKTTGTFTVNGGVGVSDVVRATSFVVDNDSFETTISTQATTDWTFNLPEDAGSVNQVLRTDGLGNTSWVNQSGGGGGSPGGVNTDVQLNAGGLFGVADDFLSGSTYQVSNDSGALVLTADSGDTSTRLDVGGTTFQLRGFDDSENTLSVASNIEIQAGSGAGAINGGNVTIVPGTSGSGINGQIINRGSTSSATDVGFVYENSGSTALVEILNAQENGTTIGEGTLRVQGGASFISGNVYGNTFNSVSDKRLKTEIEKIENPLDKLLHIDGYTYKWKKTFSEDQRLQYGVMAQQLESAGLKDIVYGNSEKKTVNYLGLIPLIIESIKELTTKINNLEKNYLK